MTTGFRRDDGTGAQVTTPTPTPTNGSGTPTDPGIDLTPDRVGPVGQYLRSLGVPYADALGAVITFVVVAAGLYLVFRAVLLPLVRRALGRRDVSENAQNPILRILRILGAFGSIAVAFGVAGYGSFLASFATIGAAATLAVGFALQDLMANFVAGVFIYVDRPFRIGHWIKWPGSGNLPNEGIVTDISLRVTRVRTFNNELLTIPNSKLTGDVVMNPTARDKLRLAIPFGIGYEDDIDRAAAILREEARDHPQILDHPAPDVQLGENALGDSYVELISLFWIADPNRQTYFTVRSEYVHAVKKRFDEAGIEIPFPQVDLSGSLETIPSDEPTANDLDAAADDPNRN